MELFNDSKEYLSPKKFYGDNKSHKKQEIRKTCSANVEPVPFELKRLLGPTSVWKVFKKQVEALTFVKGKTCGLMTFVFQQNNGERLFLAAHPRWLWYYDSIKDQKYRCSYELIPEYTVCKLYFDLEFESDVNQKVNGVVITETFIKIVCYYLKTLWKLVIDRTNIIDLDSTTDLKFSRHLIFNLPNCAFRDNYNVGIFVKYVCNEIRSCIRELQQDCNFSNTLIDECNQNGFDIRQLQVKNSKGATIIFCDEGVYSKNRHFRVFKSTKLNKNAPLILSEENLYKPKDCSLQNIEEQFFLDSLITYIPNADDNLRILQFNENGKKTSVTNKLSYTAERSENCKSPFSKVDQFIESFVYPGHIWKSNYFQTSNIIVYDIIGNRYCGNIGRQHRSNNVKQIVDINNRCYYQKCYDPDCSTYRSESRLLPPEVQFYLDDEFDTYFSESEISFESSFNDMNDTELVEIADIVEQISCE